MTTLEPIACSTDDNSRMNNQLADHPTRRSSSSAATGSPKNKKKSASLPQETVEYLKNWMMSPEHITHPYPTEQEKAHIMKETGIELKQLTNWFVNNRKRYWKPRVEARLQKQAKAHAGPAIIPGATPLGKTKRSAPVTPPRQQSLVHVVSTHNVVSLTEEQNVERSTEGDRRSGAGSRSGSIVSCTASESESVGIYYEHDDISTNQTTDEPFVCMERGCVSVDAGAPKAVGAVDVSASVKNIGDDLLQTHIGCEILSSILKKVSLLIVICVSDCSWLVSMYS